MLEKLKEIEGRYTEVEARLNDPETYNDRLLAEKLNREQRELAPIMEAFRTYEKHRGDADEAQQLLETPGLDAEFRELAQSELLDARRGQARWEEKIKRLLLPRDPNDSKSVIVEIRAGVGGEEAALFAHSLHRMYTMYAEARRWRIEVLNLNETELGGVKEISFLIEGEGVYGRLKYESGAHRVQRVPETESGGRVHTSTVTVAVLPEVEEVEFELNPNDLKVDTFRASGAGGQHVNKTDSAIRITHLPTGMVVECQDERSQHKNRSRALQILRSRLYEQKMQEQTDAIASTRRSQVGTGMRNERIRTYNFPQGRVTEHRIGLTIYKLDTFMDGEIDEVVDALITTKQAEQLQSGE